MQDERAAIRASRRTNSRMSCSSGRVLQWRNRRSPTIRHRRVHRRRPRRRTELVGVAALTIRMRKQALADLRFTHANVADRADRIAGLSILHKGFVDFLDPDFVVAEIAYDRP